MNTTSTVSSDIIAHDFTVAMHGRLDQEKIDAVVNKLTTTTTNSYPAVGSVASLIAWLQFTVDITNGKSFKGDAGALSTPGGGALFGNVYTDDIEKLYKHTHSFEFQGTPVYLSILFFDAHSNLLGHFQAGAVSTVIGIGGGKGSWHKK